MAKYVPLPNGKIGHFPDNMSDSAIQAVLQKQFPPSRNTPSNNESSFTGNAIRYGIKDPLIGLTKFGESLANAPHNLTALISERAAKHVPKLQEMDYSSVYGIKPEELNTIDKIIQFSPELLASFAVPATRLGSLGRLAGQVPKAGKYLKSALENAVSQGLFAASQSPQDQREAALEAAAVGGPFSVLSRATSEGSPVLRKLAKTVLGGGGATLGYLGGQQTGVPGASEVGALLGGALGYRGLNPQRQVAEDLLRGVEGTNYKENLEAAKRLGLTYLTPAEASGSPFAGTMQGNVGKTEKGAQLLYERGKERLQSEKSAIDKLLKTVFEEKMEPRVKSAYESAYSREVPENILEPIKDNEVFKKAIRVVQSRPAYKESLKGIPENSVAYLDRIKQAMDDMIEKAPGKEGRIIKQTRNKLLEITDKAAPEYPEARSLAEREITRRNIEEAFNKKEMRGSIFGDVLKNDKKYKELHHNLRNVPEAQQQLEDMKKIFGRLINPPTAKIAEAMTRTSMLKDRSDTGFLSRFFKEFMTGGKYDKAAVELITNPNWANELEKLKNISSHQKLARRFYDLMSKAGAQSIAQKTVRKNEKE